MSQQQPRGTARTMLTNFVLRTCAMVLSLMYIGNFHHCRGTGRTIGPELLIGIVTAITVLTPMSELTRRPRR